MLAKDWRLRIVQITIIALCMIPITYLALGIINKTGVFGFGKGPVVPVTADGSRGSFYDLFKFALSTTGENIPGSKLSIACWVFFIGSAIYGLVTEGVPYAIQRNTRDIKSLKVAWIFIAVLYVIGWIIRKSQGVWFFQLYIPLVIGMLVPLTIWFYGMRNILHDMRNSSQAVRGVG